MQNQIEKNALNTAQHRLVWKIIAAVLCRLVLNTARRFAYPFAPVLSRGLGVPLTSITSLIAVNWATTVLAIFFGPLADRIGYRRLMVAGMLLLTMGMFAGGVFPIYIMVFVALFLAGIGKSIFDPALHAYISERVPYRRRGMVIGYLEIAWAGSTLLGIPLIALLINKYGWRSPFFAMGVVGILGIAALLLLFQRDHRSKTAQTSRIDYGHLFREILRQKQALGAVGYIFFFSIAIDNLFVVYGAWLEQSFSIGLVALGLGTGAIGAAELIGELMTATLSDRIGLKRTVIGGVGVCIITYALLPFIARTLSLAYLALFIHFLVFEFTVVSSISLCTELMPGMRATFLSVIMAAAGIGRIIGALMGGPIWLAGGIFATGMVSAIISVFALLSLCIGLRNWRN